MKKINKNFLILLITLIVLIVFNLLVIKTDDYFGYLMIPLGIIFGYIISIVIHEFGHFVFGLLSGYEFVSFTVMGLTITKQKGKLKLIYQGFMGFIAGQCLMSPPKNRKFILYNLGGLIFSYCFSFILMLLMINQHNNFINQFVFGIVLLNTLLAVMNSIYNKNGVNDICNVIRGIKNKNFLEGFFYQLDTVANLTNGKKVSASKFKPKENSGHIYSDVTIYRLKYYEAYEKKDREKLDYYYKLIKGNLNSIGMFLIKVPLLFIVLFHEFAILDNTKLVSKTLKRFNSKELIKLKKYESEYQLYLFYLNSVVGNESILEEFWQTLDSDAGYESLTVINKKMNRMLKRKYCVLKGIELNDK